MGCKDNRSVRQCAARAAPGAAGGARARIHHANAAEALCKTLNLTLHADLATAVARALEQEGAAAAALLPALPPATAEVEALAARSAAPEAAAAEALAGEWFALLPALAARAPGPCLAAALLQARMLRRG